MEAFSNHASAYDLCFKKKQKKDKGGGGGITDNKLKSKPEWFVMNSSRFYYSKTTVVSTRFNIRPFLYIYIKCLLSNCLHILKRKDQMTQTRLSFLEFTHLAEMPVS